MKIDLYLLHGEADLIHEQQVSISCVKGALLTVVIPEGVDVAVERASAAQESGAQILLNTRHPVSAPNNAVRG